MTNDNTPNDIQPVWELMKKVGFAMLVTRDGDRLRARSMSACFDREANAISFAGTAAISNDRDKIRQLFSTPAKSMAGLG